MTTACLYFFVILSVLIMYNGAGDSAVSAFSSFLILANFRTSLVTASESYCLESTIKGTFHKYCEVDGCICYTMRHKI